MGTHQEDSLGCGVLMEGGVGFEILEAVLSHKCRVGCALFVV